MHVCPDISFVGFFLRPINNLSVIKGQVLLGWTSTKLRFMFLFKDTTQRHRWGSNPRPLGLKSSTLPLSHCGPVCPDMADRQKMCKTDYHFLSTSSNIMGFIITIIGFLINVQGHHPHQWASFQETGLVFKYFLRRPKGRRSNIALALNYSPIRSIFKM